MMHDTVWMSLPSHILLSGRLNLLQQVPQWLCPVWKRFNDDHWHHVQTYLRKTLNLGVTVIVFSSPVSGPCERVDNDEDEGPATAAILKADIITYSNIYSNTKHFFNSGTVSGSAFCQCHSYAIGSSVDYSTTDHM